MKWKIWVPALFGSVPWLASLPAAAQSGGQAPSAASLGSVVVTATRTPESAYDVPASVDRRDADALNGDNLDVNITQALLDVPGVLARDRENYAQDQQISIRGFGARSTFGVSGVRLYLDGIPATQPDGQGQVSHFNLASAGHVEVLRGPFSALYGNSSGGVIQLFTADGTPTPQWTAAAAGGSFGIYRASLDARGMLGRGDYNLAFSHFHTDGTREHNAARRESFNGKFNLPFSGGGKLTLLLNGFSSPEAQDPLGLTKAEFAAAPRSADPSAAEFNTRKSVEQYQVGAVYEQALGGGQSLRALGYYGNRQVRQFLAIPVATQSNPLHPGAVVDLLTDFGGTDLRWTARGRVLDRPWSLSAGADYDELSQHRFGYLNFVGSTLGVQGSLRRDEIDEVFDIDQYLQASLIPARDWVIDAGLRHSSVHISSADRFVSATNPDNSGGARHSAVAPVAGVLYKASPALHLYASYGAGFETPTLAQFSYRPDGSPGLNFALQPERSQTAEAGAKLRLHEAVQGELVVFRALTRDEIVIDTNSGGRSTYENAGRTRRQGVETGLDFRLASRWSAHLAYTYLDAVVGDPYLTCSGTPCKAPTTLVAAGKRLPAVPESDFYASIGWGAETGWHAALYGQYASEVPADDVNSGIAPAYGIFGIEGGYVRDCGHARVSLFARFDNIANNHYVGSVIVTDANTRFFEPGPERSALAGVKVEFRPY